MAEQRDQEQQIALIKKNAEAYFEKCAPSEKVMLESIRDEAVRMYVPNLAEKIVSTADELARTMEQVVEMKKVLDTYGTILVNMTKTLQTNPIDVLMSRVVKCEKLLHKVSSNQGIISSRVSSVNTSFSSRTSHGSNFRGRGGPRRSRGRGSRRGGGGRRGGHHKGSSRSRSPIPKKGNLLSKDDEEYFQKAKKDIKTHFHKTPEEWKRLPREEQERTKLQQRQALQKNNADRLDRMSEALAKKITEESKVKGGQ